MYPAEKIANYFILKGLLDEKPVTHLKLQKLVYFAHGWHLAMYNTPLIDEEVQAWKYGPVILSLYHKLKHYGKTPINMTIPETPKETGLSSQPNGELGEDMRKFLDFIWRVYGRHTAVDLATLAHVSDSPWAKTIEANGGGFMIRDAVIGNELIKEYFVNEYRPNG